MEAIINRIHYWDISTLALLLLITALLYDYSVTRLAGFKRRLLYAFIIAKVIYLLSFIWVYVKYYKSGDVFHYELSSEILYNLLLSSPQESFELITYPLLGKTIFVNSFFELNEYHPYIEYFRSKSSFLIVIISTFIKFLFGNSFINCNITFAVVGGVSNWQLFNFFYSKIKSNKRNIFLAILILFLPTVNFFLSGISKEVVYFFAFSNLLVFIKCKFRHNIFLSFISALSSGLLLLIVKPFVFIASILITSIILIPQVIWKALKQLATLHKIIISIITIVLFLIIFTKTLSFYHITFQYIIDEINYNRELTQSRTTGNNKYDLNINPKNSFTLLFQSPTALVTTLYRPFIWEKGERLVLLLQLENVFLLFMTFYLFWVIIQKPKKEVLNQVNSVTMFCLLFSVIYSAFLGLSVGVYGTLVRYRIIIIPLFYYSLLELSNKTLPIILKAKISKTD